MGEFFHGWRPKTGVVTLVLACVVSIPAYEQVASCETEGRHRRELTLLGKFRSSWARLPNWASQRLTLRRECPAYLINVNVNTSVID